MKRNGKRNRLIALAAAVILILLLFLLTAAEQEASNATIHTPWDALWYFLATITTVGYGDTSPVTPLGKILGVIFILLSCGFISFLITATIRFMNSSTILRLRTTLARVDRWYLFDSCCSESRCLAEKLWNQSEDEGIIFCGASGHGRGFFRSPCIYTALSVQDTLSICEANRPDKESASPFIFLVGANEDENLKTGLELVSTANAEYSAQIYCRTCVRFQFPPKGLHTFDPTELAARTYWSEHPLANYEKNVVLIGSGSLLNFLIEQAVLVNVFGPLMHCCYHIFTENAPDSSERRRDDVFLEDHAHIGDVISVLTDSDCHELPCDSDILHFYSGSWNTNHGCLMTADRIIICTNSEIDNIRIAEKIQLLLATQARTYIYGSDTIDGITGFGSLDDLYRPEHILREEIQNRARTLNDYYNSLQEDESRKTRWEDLSMFARRSNMAAADHMGTKLRILTDNLDKDTPLSADPDTVRLALKNFRENGKDRNLYRRIEHERWMRFQAMYGWTYGEERNNTLRQHPLMVPFEDLTPEQQAMDDISWELLDTL